MSILMSVKATRKNDFASLSTFFILRALTMVAICGSSNISALFVVIVCAA